MASSTAKPKKKKTRTQYKLVCQCWLESERGWGQRPDGYSLHLTEEDRQKFVEEYTKDRTGEAPDVYDRPSGTPYEIVVSKAVYDKVQRASKNKHGIRSFGKEPVPGCRLEKIT